MNLRGMRADAVYTLRSWYRVRINVIIHLATPVMILVGLGLIFGGAPTTTVALHVEDRDHSDKSSSFVAVLAGRGDLLLSNETIPAGTDTSVWMKAHHVGALLLIPAGFGQDIDQGRHPAVTLMADPGSELPFRLAQGAVEASLASFNQRELPNASATSLRVEPVALSPNIPYSSFLLPGVIGLTVFSVGISQSYGAIAQLRIMGLLQRLAMSPMTKREWLLARMAAFSAISLLTAVFLIVVAFAFFHPQIRITMWTALLIVGGTLVFAGIGTVLGAAIKQMEVGGAILNLLMFPMILFSGSFFDVNRLPALLRWLPAIFPLTYLNDGLRADMLGGDSGTTKTYTGVLFLMAAILALVGTKLIHWTDED